MGDPDLRGKFDRTLAFIRQNFDPEFNLDGYPNGKGRPDYMQICTTWANSKGFPDYVPPFLKQGIEDWNEENEDGICTWNPDSFYGGQRYIDKRDDGQIHNPSEELLNKLRSIQDSRHEPHFDSATEHLLTDFILLHLNDGCRWNAEQQGNIIGWFYDKYVYHQDQQFTRWTIIAGVGVVLVGVGALIFFKIRSSL